MPTFYGSNEKVSITKNIGKGMGFMAFFNVI